MNLFPKNIYKYSKNSGEQGLCVYICDTDNSNEIIVGCIEDVDSLNNDFLKMENGLSKVLYLDRFLTLKKVVITSPLYLRGKQATITSLEFYKLTINIYKLIILKYEKNIESLANKNLSGDKLIDIALPESIFKLLTWNSNKLELKYSRVNLNLQIMKYCIYFAYMGTNIGSETNKLRPVLVWKKHENKLNHDNDFYYVFPLSSKSSGANYSYNISLMLNGTSNKIMLNQGRVLSRKRFVKIFEDTSKQSVYMLSQEEKKKIRKELKNYFCT